jgi:hypothetical protein
MKDRIIARLLKLETDLKKEQDKIKRKYTAYTGTDLQLEKAKGMEHSYIVCQSMVTDVRHDIMRMKEIGKYTIKSSKM